MNNGAGSLGAKAMIVDLKISFWSGFKIDRNITADVNAEHQTDGRFNKRLVPKVYMEQLRKAKNEVVHCHQHGTLPWSDRGQRILRAS